MTDAESSVIMTWIIRWELRQPTPLTLEQRQIVERSVDRTMTAEDGCTVYGAAAMPHARAHPLWAALLSSLSELRAAFPDATCKVTDDMGLVGWNAAASCYDHARDSIRDEEPPSIQAPTNASSVGDCADVARLEATVPAPTMSATPSSTPTSGNNDQEAEVRALLGQIASTSDSFDLRRSLEHNHDPVLVARLALDMLPFVDDRIDMTAVVREALGKIDDLEPLREPLLALWHMKPPGHCWLHDVGSALQSAASKPIVLARAIRALDDCTVNHGEKLRAAVRLLGKARDAANEALPVLAARARRDRHRLLRDAYWRDDLIGALGELRQPAAFATLLLEGESEDAPRSRLIEAMMTLDPSRTLGLVPRMIDLPAAALGLATALGDVRSEQATALLRQLARHPLARVRGYSARHLASRGAAELPLVAAIWMTLDAGASPDDINRYDRGDFLAALGLDRGTPKVDWNERIAALGMIPMTLPPLPDALENLTHSDGEVRTRALRAIDENPRLENLLAIALTAELQDVMHRRCRQVEEYRAWYRWREASGMPGWLREAGDGVPQLVRAHASELPEQRMTPVLEEILVNGAEWFVDRLPPPVFRLTDEELWVPEILASRFRKFWRPGVTLPQRGLERQGPGAWSASRGHRDGAVGRAPGRGRRSLRRGRRRGALRPRRRGACSR